MGKFKELLKRSKRNIEKELYFSEGDAQIVYRLIQDYYKEKPEATDSEIYDYFLDVFYKESRDLLTLPTIRSSTIRYNTCRYLIDNPDEIRVAYEKLHREELSGKKLKKATDEPYNSNRLSAVRKLVNESLSLIREQKEFISPEVRISAEIFFKKSRKAQNEFKRNLSPENRRNLDSLRDLFTGTEVDQVEAFLKSSEYDLASQLRENYIIILEFLGERFEKFGILNKNYEEQKKLYEKLGFPELTYPLEDEEDNNSIKKLFSRKTLEGLENAQLANLVVFWINRYTKMVGMLNKSLFMINQLGLWEQIKNANPNQKDGSIHLEIDSSKLEKTYEKMGVLRFISSEVFALAKKVGEGTVEVNEQTTTKVLSIDVTQAVDAKRAEYEEDYNEYFSDLSTNSNETTQNDFLTDFENFRILENAMSNAYRLKDMNLIALLSNLYYTQNSTNWGVIFEENKDIQTSDKILIGVDVSGLNMPLRVHADRMEMVAFFRANQNCTHMPIYEGANDFQIMGTKIGTPILMPLDKKKREAVGKLEAEQVPGTGKKRFLSHLAYLSNYAKYPEHLKVEKIHRKKGKVKTIKVIPPRRYVDLVSGEQFTIGENGEQIPVKNPVEREI